MSQMTFTSPRATFEETLAFANAVRELGGANPLEALMPAIPKDPKQCLIAKNLNFNCEVRGVGQYLLNGEEVPRDRFGDWAMHFGPDKELRDRIADALELEKLEVQQQDSHGNTVLDPEGEVVPDYIMILPPEIGQVAADFDRWTVSVSDYREWDPGWERYREIATEFAPYVKASIRESQAHGIFNERGELIV